MPVRDEIERIVRAWDRHEVERGAAPIVDFDCAPPPTPPAPVSGRLEALRLLTAAERSAREQGLGRLAADALAHVTYLRAFLGERLELSEYVERTQGCPAIGWSAEHVEQVGELARAHLDGLGISWDERTLTTLADQEGPIEAIDAGDAIRRAADHYEPAVRALGETTAPFTLDIEQVETDAYWQFWLDGSGSSARLRLNLKRTAFTEVRARQFALHEVLGHALQSVSYTAGATADDETWPRVLTVHAPQQVLLEGLAQAMPLFVAPDDPALMARVRLDHYHALVHAELHLKINAGVPADECAAHARRRVPYWTDAAIANLLRDRGADPLLRSYLYSYPAGIDWFVALADSGDTVAAKEVLRAAFRTPLTPGQLHELWPAGPCPGGG